MSLEKLTPKQQRFVPEYLIDLNATAAATRAGYSERSAKKIGFQLLQRPEVAAAIQAAKAARSKEVGITAEWVLRTLAEEKTADLADLYDEAGNLLPIKKWPMVFRRGLVVGIETVEEGIGAGENRAVFRVRKVKLSDRIKHLELIGRHVDVQAFRDTHALTGINGSPLELKVDLSGATIEQLRVLAGLRLRDAGG